MANYYTSINLNQNELQKAVVENYAGNPDTVVSGVDGQILYDSTNNLLYYCTGGTSWTSLSSAAGTVTSVSAGNAITVTGTATTPIVNHADTSTQGNINNSGNTFIQDLTFDTYGHVTGATSTAVSSLDNYVSWTAAGDTGTYDVTSGATLTVEGGTNVTTSISGTTLTIDATNTVTNAFSTISVLGQSDVVADSTSDDLVFLTGGGMTITTNAATDEITFTSANDNDYVDAATFDTANGELTLSVSSQADVVVDLDGRYLTSYAETQTLDDVTDLGSSTTNSITVGGLVVNGDLTVSGAHTVKLAEEVQLEDSLIILNSNETGAPTEDAGIIVERGTLTNVGMIYDETGGEWAFITTAETGTTAGDVTITDYNSVRLGNLYVEDNAYIGNVAALGSAATIFLTTGVGGQVQSRTAAQVRSDIGAGTGSMDDFTIAADSGTANTITNGETFTIVGGGDVSTVVSANQISVNFTESYTGHVAVAPAADQNNAGFTFVQDVTLDSNGHVTGMANATVTAATSAAAGVIELATNQEASAGTDTTRAVTAAGMNQFRGDREAVFTISGDGATTTFTLTHNFGTRMVMAEMVDFGNNGTGATYQTVYADYDRDTDDTLRVGFGAAPSSSQDFRVMLRVIE